MQKRRSCEVVGASSFPKAVQVCVEEDLAFLIVDLTFHCHWHICQVRCQPSCRGSFAWLGSHPSLATCKDATDEVVLATWHKCSAKLCFFFGPFDPHLYSKRQLRKNQNFSTATRAEIM